jgi:hypothetical protein
MLKKDKCIKIIKSFYAKHAIEASDENIITTLHIMNTHGIDINAALDQSSRNSNDKGIDGWYYDSENAELFIYQSKMTESKSLTLSGLRDFGKAVDWLECVIIDGKLEKIPNDNHSLYNLYIKLSENRENIKKINFILISLYDSNELEDSLDYQECQDNIIKSKLNKFIRDERKGKIVLLINQYNLEISLPKDIKKYTINKIVDSNISLRKNAHLDLAYISLYSLIDLYRQRGDILFDKNVRLSLINKREARERLVNPLENTLNNIISNNLNPNIFPFYHIGVTVAANSQEIFDSNLMSLEAPSIINGCQTITIANEFLKKLERKNDLDKIEIFKKIKVIAKVVVGTSNEELREITNSNNRQNPIENWQLFSNEPIHIEIEATLKDMGVFYERQEGKFESIMKLTDYAKYYNNTHGTCIKVTELGQLICLSLKKLQWAAKPSEIFLNKENHDSVFIRDIPKYPQDIILVCNFYKSMKRALKNYLDLPTHANDYTQKIYSKQIVRHYIFYVALLNFYQHNSKFTVRKDYSKSLLKIASPTLGNEFESFYQKIITKTKNWYLQESKDLSQEVSYKKMEAYFSNLETDLGIDSENGSIPFSKNAINWDEYKD